MQNPSTSHKGAKWNQSFMFCFELIVYPLTSLLHMCEYVYVCMHIFVGYVQVH